MAGKCYLNKLNSKQGKLANSKKLYAETQGLTPKNEWKYIITPVAVIYKDTDFYTMFHAAC